MKDATATALKEKGEAVLGAHEDAQSIEFMAVTAGRASAQQQRAKCWRKETSHPDDNGKRGLASTVGKSFAS